MRNTNCSPAERDWVRRSPPAWRRFWGLGTTPGPASIMQVQRDLLVQDVMERHFDGAELSGVVAEIDKLFAQRFDDLVNSMQLGKPPRGSGGGSGGGHGGGHGGGRKPRHLH